MSKNSSDFLLRFSIDDGVNFEYVAMSTDAAWSRSKDVRDITTKYSNGYRELGAGGKKMFEVSGSGFVVYSSTDGHLVASNFDSVFKNNTRVYVEIVDAADSQVRLLGIVENVNYDISSGTEDTLVYDLQFNGHKWFAQSHLDFLNRTAASIGAES